MTGVGGEALGAGPWNDRMPGNAGRRCETVTESLKCIGTRRVAVLASELLEGWNQGSPSMVVFSRCLVNMEGREREYMNRT